MSTDSRWYLRQVLGSLTLRLDGQAQPYRLDERLSSLVVPMATSERVVPLVAEAVGAGRLEVASDSDVELQDLWCQKMVRCLRIESALLWLVGETSELGIELRVLKGPAAAHLDFDDSSHRQFGDLDVLVRSADLDRVVELLEGEGFRRQFSEPRPGFAASFWKSVSLRGPIEVDVHRTLADGPVGTRIPVDELWGEGERFVVAGTSLTALSREHRLIHSCLHARLASPPARLSVLADIACLLRSGIVPDDVADTVRRWRLGDVVGGAVAETMMTGCWPATVPAGWLAPFDQSAVDAFLVASHRGSSPSWAARSVLTAFVEPGLRRRMRYLIGLAAPREGYGESRHASGRERLRHAASQFGGVWRS